MLKTIFKNKIKKVISLFNQKKILKRNNIELIVEKLMIIDNIKILNLESLPIKVLLDDIYFEVNSLEEAFILKELYNDNDYYFSLNKEIILIDVGMNVGFTSLFLSKKENIKKIYSFEPVDETYNLAQKNFKLNPKLSNKILPHNFGLGNSDCMIEFIYSKEYKGSVGIRGLKSWNIRNANDRKKINVEIKNSSDIFKPIIEENINLFIVCKFDCEGAEYEILQNLFNSELINKIGLFIIEYHDDGPEILEDLLFKSGFITIRKRTALHLGIIYAYNTNINSN
jgi:FkbM family methyltransferase